MTDSFVCSAHYDNQFYNELLFYSHHFSWNFWKAVLLCITSQYSKLIVFFCSFVHCKLRECFDTSHLFYSKMTSLALFLRFSCEKLHFTKKSATTATPLYNQLYKLTIIIINLNILNERRIEPLNVLRVCALCTYH